MLTSTCSQIALSDVRKPIKSYEIEQQVYELCTRAQSLISSSNYGMAISTLQQAAKFDPTSYSDYVHEKMSECYSESNQTDKAIQEAELALKFDPSSGEAHYYLAQLYYRTDHYDTATFYLNKLLQITKDKQWAARAKELLRDIETYGKASGATDQIKAGHYLQARKLLEDAAKYDPSPVSKNIHQNLAYVLRELKKPELAVAEGKKALQYDGTDSSTMYSIALCLQDIGEYDESIQWLRRLLQYERDPARRKNASDMIAELESDKPKLNSVANKAPDYLESMVGSARELHRWPQSKLPIKVFINSGAGVKGFRAEYPSFIKHALDTWCTASGRKLSFKIVSDENAADLTVVWLDTPIVMDEDGRKRIKQGLASTQRSAADTIDSVKVQVDTMNALRTSQALESGECAFVCLHEIGHSLGLNHSTSMSDVMFFGSSSKQTGELTSRDKATIARLYQAYPVNAAAPVEQKAPPIKFEPPPTFMPPLPGNEKDITPPMFLPPPVEDEEKLTPPFFQPPPVNDNPAAASGSKNTKQSIENLPPLFMPPPVEAASSKQSNRSKSQSIPSAASKAPAASSTKPLAKATSIKQAPKSTAGKKQTEPASDPFFAPPPVN